MTAIGKAFDYVVPPAMAGRVEVGTEVRVVLHGRRVWGWVVELGVTPPAGVVLRPLVAVRSVGPPPAVLGLAEWAAWRWAGRPSTLLRTASSATVVRALPTAGPRRPPAVPTGPGHDAVGDPWIGAEALAEVFAGGPCVVRLPPAAPTDAVVLAAVARAAASGSARSGAGTLVLAPGQHQAWALAGRLRRLGHRVATLPDQWAEAGAGGGVVVGSRA
ncbi:MAG TPA: hypothetical protein VMU09_00450, partial [Acidimicrobiales bacterium]|nr:hypothetical protein [Acidimicrobiales bacterium]